MADGKPSWSRKIDRGLGEHSELVAGVVIGGLASFGVWFLVTGGDAATGAGFSASVTGVVAALIVYAYAQRRAKTLHNWIHLLVIAMTLASLALYAFVWEPQHAAVHAIVWIVSVLALLATTSWAERQDPHAPAVVFDDEPAPAGPLEDFFEDAEPDATEPDDSDDTVIITPPEDGPPPPEKG